MQKNKNEIIEYINGLDGYEGYVQFSDRPINKEKDIFHSGKKVHMDDESGFVYEAHFCNGMRSVGIKKLNGVWYVSEADISQVEESDTQTYVSDIKEFNKQIKMAQIWKEELDELCEGMMVKKLKKVVFAGFVGDEK